MKFLLPLLIITAAPAAFAQADTPARCAQLGDQLTEYLASARQRIGQDGEVRIAFDVDARGRTQLHEVDGTRRYLTPVRIAVNSLDCQAGTPQRYVLHIRFADASTTLAALPAPVASAASGSLAQAATPR